MKLKATLTLIAASLFLAACDQSGSAAKENAKAESANSRRRHQYECGDGANL